MAAWPHSKKWCVCCSCAVRPDELAAQDANLDTVLLRIFRPPFQPSPCNLPLGNSMLCNVIHTQAFKGRVHLACDASLQSSDMQVLAYQADGTLVTGDAPTPVALGTMPGEVVEKFADKLQPGLLLRFTVGAQGFLLDEHGGVAGADLKWQGVASQLRGAGDKYSRLVFQWQQRQGAGHAVSIADLLLRVEKNADAPATASLPIHDNVSELDGIHMVA